MDDVTEESIDIVQRVAALDIGKATLTACVRVPHEDKPGRRRQEIREYSTMTRAYWKPVFYILEAQGLTCWLLNARHVKNVPGRPKTDKLDAVWLAKVTERGMCRPSLVHPKPIRQLRNLTRYRRTQVRTRSAERQRLEKLLEDAQIKPSSMRSPVPAQSPPRS